MEPNRRLLKIVLCLKLSFDSAERQFNGKEALNK